MNLFPPLVGAPRSGRTTLRAQLLALPHVVAESAKPRMIVVLDWLEGLRDETLWQLGVITPEYRPDLILAINKLDLAGFEYEAFKIARSQALAKLAVFCPENIAAVPISAKFGDGIATKSDRIEWYQGPALRELIAPVLPPAPYLAWERRAA